MLLDSLELKEWPPLEVADLVGTAGDAFFERSRKWIYWKHVKVLLTIARGALACLADISKSAVAADIRHLPHSPLNCSDPLYFRHWHEALSTGIITVLERPQKIQYRLLIARR
jgi:hypothetical protein